MSFRFSVKTNLGNFLCTPVQTAAKVDSERGKEYILVGELRKGDRVYVSKVGAEQITLEDHIIPTLWSRSREYREDRRQVFKSGTTEVPRETWLSHYLNSIAETSNGATEAARLIHDAVRVMPEELRYSYSGVAAWLNNEVMFPEKPEVLLKLADVFHAPVLREWTLSIMNQNQMPVKRLRIIHRQIRANLAKPIGTQGKSSTLADSEDKHAEENPQAHVNVGNLIGLIRREYGEHSLSEFVTVAEVLENPLQVSTDSKNDGSDPAPSGSYGLSRRIIGFSYTKPEERLNVIGKYGEGAESSKKLEMALLQRKELACALMERFKQILSPIESEWIGRYGYDDKKTYNIINGVFSNALLLGNTSAVGLTIDEMNMYRIIASSRKERDFIRGLLNLTDKDRFYAMLNEHWRKIDCSGSIGPYRELINRIYNDSVVEKFVVSREGFLSIYGIDIDGIRHVLSSTLENFKYWGKEQLVQSIEQEIKHIKKVYQHISEDAEFNRIISREKELHIPFVFKYAQSGGYLSERNFEHVKKLMLAYGIKTIPKIEFKISITTNQNPHLNTMNPEISILTTDMNSFYSL
jgi:hypothetical protein